MFSANEIEYLKPLILTMRDKGYPYYVAYTTSANGPDTDFKVLFSKTPIGGDGVRNFHVDAGLLYSCRMSNSYQSSIGYRDTLVCSSFSGSLSVPVFETIYTNFSYGAEAVTIHPDLTGGEVRVNNAQVSLNFLIALFFLVVVGVRLFR